MFWTVAASRATNAPVKITHRDGTFTWESGNLLNWIPTPQLAIPSNFIRDGVYQDLGIPVRSGNPFAEGRRFFQLEIEE